jgi:hypothetical protein
LIATAETGPPVKPRLDVRRADALIKADADRRSDKPLPPQGAAPAPAARSKPLPPAAERALAEAAARRAERDHADAARPKEKSGRSGLDPARYGDWEVKDHEGDSSPYFFDGFEMLRARDN